MRWMFVCAALCVCCPINTTQDSPPKSQDSLLQTVSLIPDTVSAIPKTVSLIPTVSLTETVRVASAADQSVQLASKLLFEDSAWSNSGFSDPIPQSSFGDSDITGSIAETGESVDEQPVRIFSKEELCSTAASVAAANNIPVPFFANLIQQESAFQPHVVSPAGAQGIAQFMPQVAEAYGLADPFDPIGALHASGKFLSELRAQFGNLGLAAAAYNAGPKRVLNWMARRGKLPAETRQYVRNITGHPPEHWTRRNMVASLVTMPLHARCAEAREALAQARGEALALATSARRVVSVTVKAHRGLIVKLAHARKIVHAHKTAPVRSRLASR